MDLFDLTGRTALVTGASSGLGERFARTLARAGARVILAARRMDRLKTIEHELSNALAIEMDVADRESVRKGFERLEQLGEKIAVCVNCAGIAKTTPLFEADDLKTFESIQQTNVMGTWYVIQAVASHMRALEIEGSIINVGSVNGDKLPAATATGYSVSKAAVIHMARSLAIELAPYKIRINTICPGFFVTEMTRETRENFSEILLKKIPLGFIGDPSDLDGAILYLASNGASRYVTGSCMTVDGGVSWSKMAN